MDQPAALAVFHSLATATRLEVFRLLVRAGPQGAVAGEIAAALDVAPSSLSFHLKSLSHAGLVTVTQEGRFQRYRARLDAINELIDFLTENCCNGLPGSPCPGAVSARAHLPACATSFDPDPETPA